MTAKKNTELPEKEKPFIPKEPLILTIAIDRNYGRATIFANVSEDLETRKDDLRMILRQTQDIQAQLLEMAAK